MSERTPEAFKVREVTRLVDRVLHRNGAHAANFIGDVRAMIDTGHFYGLDRRDFRFLTFALDHCVRPALNAEGAEVSMSNRQWGAFVGTRRKYLHARRNPQNFLAQLASQHRVTPTREIIA